MKYLLTFKPLKNFFFGNDKTFSDDYFATSEYFPQNTQLLGAIRLFIAEQNGLMHVHRNGKYSNEPQKLKELIGDANANNFTENKNLGKIQNLSGMFLVKNTLDDAYFPTPFDIEISKDSIRYYQLTSIDNEYFFLDYDVKNASSQHFGNSLFWTKYINKEPLHVSTIAPFEYDQESKKGFFKRHTQVGIALDKKQVIDEKFYAKIDYALRDNYLFGAIIELQEEIIADGIIQIGAESSLFELNVHKLHDYKALQKHPLIDAMFETSKEGSKVVAISDCIVPHTKDIGSIYSVVHFNKMLRMIKAENKDGSFKKETAKDKNYNKYKNKTQPQRLIPKGSVFYFNNDICLDKPAQGAYAKMGYNKFIAVKN